jgi:hypothetical protein
MKLSNRIIRVGIKTVKNSNAIMSKYFSASITTDYSFEAENLKDDNKGILNNDEYEGIIKLVKYIKCPISGSDLEITPIGDLKADYIEYKKINGVFLLTDEKAVIKL